MALTNANDDDGDVRGVNVIVKVLRVAFTKNSFTKAELVVFLASKFCNSQIPGTETLNLAVER